MPSYIIEEGWQYIRETETATFSLNVTKVGLPSDAVSNPSMTVVRRSDGVDVTNEVTEGDMSIEGQLITLKRIKGLERGKTYRITVAYTKGGEALETLFVLHCPSR